MLDDARHVWRRVRSRPGIALLAASMLALGIGLSTAMFTVVDSLLLRPVPFPDADRLARVSMQGPTGGRIGVPPAVPGRVAQQSGLRRCGWHLANDGLRGGRPAFGLR